MRVGLVGARGLVGRAVAAQLRDAGHELVVLARDPQRCLEALRGDGLEAEAAALDLDGPSASLRPVLTEAAPDVVIDAVGASGHALAEATVAASTPLVDLTADLHAVRERIELLDGPAREVGTTVVVGAGVVATPGDLLAAVAGSAVTRPRELHVAHVLPDGGLRRAASVGMLRTAASLVARPVLALDAAELTEEPLAEARRLAWFPRPVGPHHAVAVPGLEPLLVPRHVGGLRTVRTYLAVRSARAELVQLLGNLARSERARPRVQRWVTGREPSDPSPELLAATRWACVVEAAGEDGVARAWMNGRDPYAITGLLATILAERVLAGRAAAGVVPPALVDVAADLLDEVAARSRVRWSVVRP